MARSISFKGGDKYAEYDDDGVLTDIIISHIVLVERKNDVSLKTTTTAGVKNLVFDSNADREAARMAILSKL